MKLVKNIITIDGPSGVGKGTLAFTLAERLGWNVLDSGLLYRLVGYLSLEEKLESSSEIVKLSREMVLSEMLVLAVSVVEGKTIDLGDVAALA